MIASPSFHACVIFGVVALVLASAKCQSLKWLFRFAPPLLLVFLIPALANSVGLLPAKSAFYNGCSTYVLPGCVVVFLLGTDLRQLRQLGKPATIAVLAGTLSVLISGILVCLVASFWLDNETWRPISSLIGGWIGGYTSLLVIKESVECPDASFATMLFVASVLAYSWIGVLSSGAQMQERFDRWVDAPESTTNSIADETAESVQPFNLSQFAIWIAACVILGQGVLAFAELLPEAPPTFSSKTIGFLLLMVVGLVGAMIKPINECFRGAAPLGGFGLFLIIATSGAKCSLLHLSNATSFLLVGVGILLLHTLMMLVVAKCFRIPLGILATASQANIGGVASSPAVAGAYKPGTESMGVLMGMLAAKLGIPGGLVAAHVLSIFFN